MKDKLLIPLSLIQHQLEDQLPPLCLWMCHSNLHSPPFLASSTFIKTPHISPTDNLSQPTILGVSDLDKVLIEYEYVGTVHGDGISLAYKLHDDASRDVAVLVDVHGTLLVAEQELDVAEAKHAEWFLARETGRDVFDMGSGTELGDGPRLFLI